MAMGIFPIYGLARLRETGRVSGGHIDYSGIVDDFGLFSGTSLYRSGRSSARGS